jgi:hypothetical protein
MPNTTLSGSLFSYQLDITNPPSSGGLVVGTRIIGIPVSNLELLVFKNNVALDWSLEDGSGVPSSSISSGKVYFHEMSGLDGYYSVRLFLNAPGVWRVIIKYDLVEYVREIDVLPNMSVPSPSGIQVSFS